jgi:hypothetical protein
VKKKQEETADEKALGKIVAAKLREQLRGDEAGCTGTETLAAYYDRSLTDRERAACDEHLLTCLRCQEYLAELARLADSDEPPPLVDKELAEEADQAAPGWTFRFAWVVPFLIIALGSGIWYREEIEGWFERRRETAMTKPQPPVVPETPAESRERDAGVKPEAAKPATLKDLAKSLPSPPPRPKPAESELARRQLAVATPTSGAEAAAPSGAMTPLSMRVGQRAAAKAAERSLAIVAEESKARAMDRAAPPEEVTTEQEAAPGPTLARKEAPALGGVTIRGAQPKFVPKWRVGTRGTIQRADPSGDWLRVPSGVSVDLFDITFAGNAGWVVGHEGTVLRSTDGGTTWNKVTAPSSEDLIRVSAQSDQEAQVITRSGQSFATSDGGRTWE